MYLKLAKKLSLAVYSHCNFYSAVKYVFCASVRVNTFSFSGRSILLNISHSMKLFADYFELDG